MKGLILGLAVAFVLVLSCAVAGEVKAGGFGFAQQAQCVQQAQVCAAPVQLQAVQQVYAVPVQVQQVYVPQVQYQQQAVVVQKQRFAVQKQKQFAVQKQKQFAVQPVQKQVILKQQAPQRQTIRQRIVTRTSRF